MINAGIAFFIAWLTALAVNLSMTGHDVIGPCVALFALLLWAAAAE